LHTLRLREPQGEKSKRRKKETKQSVRGKRKLGMGLESIAYEGLTLSKRQRDRGVKMKDRLRLQGEGGNTLK